MTTINDFYKSTRYRIHDSRTRYRIHQPRIHQPGTGFIKINPVRDSRGTGSRESTRYRLQIHTGSTEPGLLGTKSTRYGIHGYRIHDSRTRYRIQDSGRRRQLLPVRPRHAQLPDDQPRWLLRSQYERHLRRRRLARRLVRLPGDLRLMSHCALTNCADISGFSVPKTILVLLYVCNEAFGMDIAKLVMVSWDQVHHEIDHALRVEL